MLPALSLTKMNMLQYRNQKRRMTEQGRRPSPDAKIPDDRLAGVLQTLEHGIEAILTSDGYQAYLKTMAKFHGYSFGNIALIMAQKRDSTMVDGFNRWKKLGRHVRKGEKGIQILVP